MDSTSDENTIMADVENIVDASSFNLLPTHGISTPSILSSFLRCTPFHTHTTPSSTPKGVDSSISEARSEFVFEPEPEPEPEPDPMSEQMLDDEERKRVANIMESGFQLLLSCEAKYNPLQHTLLGLKVTMEIEHEQILRDFEEYLAVEIPRKEPRTYEFKAEEAVGLLLDYAGFWKHSCSIVLVVADDGLSTLRDRILSSNIRGRRQPKNNQSSSDHAEVVLFVLVDGQIGDKNISDSEELLKFLSEQSEEKMLKVHVTCSSATMKEENPTFSHLVIHSFEDVGTQ